MINKVIEVLAKSSESWEDAVQKAVNEAAHSVKHIRSVYVENFSAKVENNRITEYRVDAKITFEVKSEVPV